MPRRVDPGTKAETKLARLRIAAKLTQEEMAELTGMSQSVYWRLERGRLDNPPLRYLVNCALVLGVQLDELIEDGWRAWLQLGEDAPSEPITAAEVARHREDAAKARAEVEKKRRESTWSPDDYDEASTLPEWLRRGLKS